MSNGAGVGRAGLRRLAYPALSLALVLGAWPVALRAEDWAYRDPTDIRTILTGIGKAGGLNLIIGEGVAGITSYVAKGRTAERAVVEAAMGAGFTVRVSGNVIAVRTRDIGPRPVLRDPVQFFVPGTTVSLDFSGPTGPRAVIEEVGRQLGRRVLVHHRVGGMAIVHVANVDPRVFLNVFCEAMGLDWGTVGRGIVVAGFRKIEHYLIDMRLDRRT